MQNTYAQNKEDLFVLNYFGDYKGTLLEIGANDGVTLSNSRLLIENDWKAILVEPGSVCEKIEDLYGKNDYVSIWPIGIGDKNERVSFWESGEHVVNGGDVGLVSTANFEETKRWPNVKFEETRITLYTFQKFHEMVEFEKFDFISIDAEGSDLSILKQIDLESVGCKCLCIEYNGNQELQAEFTAYCKGFNLKLAAFTPENLIFLK